MGRASEGLCLLSSGTCARKNTLRSTHRWWTCATLRRRATYETPEANVYEFHLSGIIDMLEKLQKQFNAELYDAQEDESNVESVGFMKVQD